MNKNFLSVHLQDCSVSLLSDMPRYHAAMGGSYAQSGFAMFGIDRQPQHQKAIDEMAGNLFKKREINYLAALLNTAPGSLVFDSDEAARLMAHPVMQTVPTALVAPNENNLTTAIRFYEYAMNVDFVLKWINNLSGQIDSLANNASPELIARLARYIIRPDFGEWEWTSMDAGADVAGSLTDVFLNGAGTIQSLEGQDGSLGHVRKAGYYKIVAAANSLDLQAHDLVLDIMALAIGYCRGTIRKVGDGVKSVNPSISDSAHRALLVTALALGADLYTGTANHRVAFQNMRDAAMSSGMDTYIGSKYLDLMQKFWITLKGSGSVFGSDKLTWAQSLDQGPLMGRRFHHCGDGMVPVFYNKFGDVIPEQEALTWKNGIPYINDGIVDMSRGGCTVGSSPDIGWGPGGGKRGNKHIGGMMGAMTDPFAYRGRTGLPFNAGAMTLADRNAIFKSVKSSRSTRAGMKAKSKRRHKFRKLKVKSKPKKPKSKSHKRKRTTRKH